VPDCCRCGRRILRLWLEILDKLKRREELANLLSETWIARGVLIDAGLLAAAPAFKILLGQRLDAD
jgi:hypothetical protein